MIPRVDEWAGRALSASARLVIFALCLLTLGCRGGGGEPERLLYSLQGGVFGTYYVVKLVVDRDAVAVAEPSPEERALPFIEEELAEVDRLMSTYRDDSEISAFNRQQTVEPIAVSPQTLEVFTAAVELAELTGGALDITVGPLVEAWGFGPSGVGGTAPADAALEEMLARVGYDKLRLDAEAGTITKTVPDLDCDLSSLAKGYGVDRVLERLVAEGFDHVLVEIGGEVRTAGQNLSGEPWRLGIERPMASRGEVQRVVALENESLATSGDYRQYREVDGRRVSHLLDPRTGRPIEHRVASVSVVDSTCMRADALATALMVLGEEEGFDVAEAQGVAALFLVRDGEGYREKVTSTFEQRFPAP